MQGKSYFVRVRAMNVCGWSDYSPWNDTRTVTYIHTYIHTYKHTYIMISERLHTVHRWQHSLVAEAACPSRYRSRQSLRDSQASQFGPWAKLRSRKETHPINLGRQAHVEGHQKSNPGHLSSDWDGKCRRRLVGQLRHEHWRRWLTNTYEFN